MEQEAAAKVTASCFFYLINVPLRNSAMAC